MNEKRLKIVLEYIQGVRPIVSLDGWYVVDVRGRPHGFWQISPVPYRTYVVRRDLDGSLMGEVWGKEYKRAPNFEANMDKWTTLPKKFVAMLEVALYPHV